MEAIALKRSVYQSQVWVTVKLGTKVKHSKRVKLKFFKILDLGYLGTTENPSKYMFPFSLYSPVLASPASGDLFEEMNIPY